MGKLEDGRTVFVPRSAPGDLVELGPVELRARFARAQVAALPEPGPGRVPPRCIHYDRDACGGCQLQHLDLETQRAAKRGFLQDALQRIGKLDVVVPELMPADAPWGYRHRITLAVGPGRRVIGFHPLDQPARVFPLERCEIAAPELQALWTALHPLAHLLPPDTSHLVLRLDRTGASHVIVRAAGRQAWTGGRDLAGRLSRGGMTAVVWWQPEGGAPRVVGGDREAFPATVFEQVHPGLGDRIRQEAVERLRVAPGEHLWDLYAGIGETTDRLVALGATVESVELDRRAVDFAERRGSPAGVRRHVGRVEELLGQLKAPAAVIANPPRTGLGVAVVDALLVAAPKRIVYISCDPATLARDLGRLCARTDALRPAGVDPGKPSRPAGEPPSLRLVSVQAYDLFPQTAHLETIAVVEAA